MYFDFLIPKRPVSVQTKRKGRLKEWKDYVKNEASKTWRGNPYSGIDIQLILVYLYNSDPLDTDNIIKPIQDALIGLVYDDDSFVTDIESHSRPLSGTFDITRCPKVLIDGIASGEECVYVRVCASRSLEEYL